MSRADRERAIYINKLNLIMENLMNKYPDLKEKMQVKEKLDKYIQEELTKVHEEESDFENEEGDSAS
jgi:predicted patatin/cPLA2 family phospholipase